MTRSRLISRKINSETVFSEFFARMLLVLFVKRDRRKEQRFRMRKFMGRNVSTETLNFNVPVAYSVASCLAC